MKEWIKKWLGIYEEKQEITAAYILANRHYLASISPSDFEEEWQALTEQDKKDYLAEAALVWSNPVFQKELKWLFGQQALFIANESANWEQSLLGRGTVNGIGLVQDRFELLNSMHQENIKPPEPIDDFLQNN